MKIVRANWIHILNQGSGIQTRPSDSYARNTMSHFICYNRRFLNLLTQPLLLSSRRLLPGRTIGETLLRTWRISNPELRLATNIPGGASGRLHSQEPPCQAAVQGGARPPPLFQVQRRQERGGRPVGVRRSPDRGEDHGGRRQRHQGHGGGVLREGEVQVRVLRVEREREHQEPAGLRRSCLWVLVMFLFTIYGGGTDVLATLCPIG